MQEERSSMPWSVEEEAEEGRSSSAKAGRMHAETAFPALPRDRGREGAGRKRNGRRSDEMGCRSQKLFCWADGRRLRRRRCEDRLSCEVPGGTVAVGIGMSLGDAGLKQKGTWYLDKHIPAAIYEPAIWYRKPPIRSSTRRAEQGTRPALRALRRRRSFRSNPA